MGFFSNALKGFTSGLTNSDIDDINEVLDLEYDDDDYNFSGNYRDVAIKYTPSNHGWYTCAKCGKKFRLKDMDADHILPKSKGGNNSTGNMQLICKHCNRSKQADTTDTKTDLRRRKVEIEEERAKDFALLAYMIKEERKNGK